MKNKILIVSENAAELEQLEAILQEVVDEGGELILARKKEGGLAALQKEQPKIIFLDAELAQDGDWSVSGSHIIWIYARHESVQEGREAIFKPFKRHQVLEKCWALLQRQSITKVPPM